MRGYHELDAVSEAQENSEVTLNAPEKDSHVTGNVDAKADGYVMCMIPYEKGWTVTVDGEETEILKGDIGFLAFKVAEKGSIRSSLPTRFRD